MRTPAWVITGLLDSGKTTLINRLVKEELNGLDVLVIQFETGEEKLQKGVKLHKMIFSKSCLEEYNIRFPMRAPPRFHRLPEVTALLSGQEVTAISLRMPEFF